MRWLTVKEVAERTKLDPQTVRKVFPLTRFGRAVRIHDGEVLKFVDPLVRSVIERDPGLRDAVRDYRHAELVAGFLDPDPDSEDDPDFAALLASSVAALRLEHPDWEPVGVDGVVPPVLAHLKAAPPQGGGPKGDALRALIAAA